ncbi:hypothetical protein Bca52824_028751 [Brassica carinata]|uniref:Nodulin-like domain-containing protein n=1 Tax=Brassica carinata TaxID=52824 RepID=A0A8X7VCR2_BRACI|nr:hypothetical protein Bca52824_028751 [Brassica carinata]
MERVNTKWVAAAASIWIQSFSGATYTFAIYSSILKSSQSYDQSTLDFVSVFKDIGGTLGIFSGLLYTAMTSTPHGRAACGGDVLVRVLGWSLAAVFNTASVVTAARNFSDYGGTAVGIMQVRTR